jgi:hypothetical protein
LRANHPNETINRLPIGAPAAPQAAVNEIMPSETFFLENLTKHNIQRDMVKLGIPESFPDYLLEP